MISLLASLLVLSLLGCSYASLATEYQNNVQLDDFSKTYMLYWSHKPADGMMEFAVEVKTTGWVAFGFANKIGNMDGYDVMISYVLPAQNDTEIRDYFTKGHKVPPIDSIQNYYLQGSSEVEGTTTVRFKRKLDTGDSTNDIAIKPGKMWVVWAHNQHDDATRKHDKKGYKQLALISKGYNAHATSWVILLTGLIGFMSLN